MNIKMMFCGMASLLSFQIAGQTSISPRTDSIPSTGQVQISTEVGGANQSAGLGVNSSSQTASTNTPQVTFNTLPPAVQTALRTEIGTNNFGNVVPMERDGLRFYEVPVLKNGRVNRVAVSENGVVIGNTPEAAESGAQPTPALAVTAADTSTTILYNDLDSPLQRAVLESAGPGPYERIDKEVRGGITNYNVALRKDGKYVRVRLNDQGKLIDDTRERPALVAVALPEESTNRLTLNDLPVAVQTSVKIRARPSEVEKVKLEQWMGKTVYTINFYRDGDHQLFRVAKDGALVQQPVIVSRAALADTNGVVVATSSLTPTQLPVAVQESVKKYAQASTVTNIRQTIQDGQTVYDIEFAQGTRAGRLYVAEDGTMIPNEGTVLYEAAGALTPPANRLVAFKELPGAVQKTINVQTQSGPPATANTFVRDGKTIYEVQIERDGVPTRLRLVEDGSIVKVD
jgi:hypothetical protein